MEEIKQNGDCGCGCGTGGTVGEGTKSILCSCALGIATVPCQQWNGTYDTEKALKRGTVFPELDLPFFLGGVEDGK